MDSRSIPAGVRKFKSCPRHFWEFLDFLSFEQEGLSTASDEFVWIAQPPDSNLTQKLNSKVSEMEESGYNLHEKDIVQESGQDGNNVVMLLHFKEEEKKARTQMNLMKQK